MKTKTEYPKPSLTADVVAFSLNDQAKLTVLLIKRGHDPFEGQWAIPGGFCEPTETVEQAAARELAEETGLTGLTIEELATFSAPGRDPRGWVVSVAHIGVVPEDLRDKAKGGDDASDARWWVVTHFPNRKPPFKLEYEGDEAGSLAFDHDAILSTALKRVSKEADRFALTLLSQSFTMKELHRTHEALLGEPVDENALRDRLLASGQIREAGRTSQGGETLYKKTTT